MPKMCRTAKEVESVKQKILDQALQLIVTEGYDKLSMRKIAGQMGITAATIYNYFKSKEEINLWIRVKGFETMDAMLSKARDAKNTQEENMRSLLKAYFKFGTVYSEYYDIMFNLRTPKVADYIGTELEEIAVTKLQKIGRRTFGYFFNLVNEVYESKKKMSSGDEIQYRTVQLWANIHGVVTLYNSRQIAELVKSPKRFIDARIEAEIRELLGNAN
ncbi:MAG: TetR/AcrR family transcriptional regulator [Deltaproteobacteria bacterium]